MICRRFFLQGVFMDFRKILFGLLIVLQSFFCVASDEGWTEVRSVRNTQTSRRLQGYGNEKGSNVNSALSSNVMNNHASVATKLIGNNAYVGQKNYKGETPLMLAAYSGDANKVTLLLKAGVCVDERDKQGSTALMYAASGGRPEVVRILIKHGANFNLQSTANKRTPLHWAIRMCKGCVEKIAKANDPACVLATVKMLLAEGANAEIRDEYNKKPLDWSLEYNLSSISRELRSAMSSKR